MSKNQAPNGFTKVWTIQHADTINTLNQDGVLRGDIARMQQDFQEAYRWMMTQMEKRIAGYSNGYPVWLWIKAEEDRHRPDLRKGRRLPRGTPSVLIEADVPSNLILPHDYALWDFVLQNEYSSASEQDLLKWEEQEPAMEQQKKQAQIRKSWDTIFAVSDTDRDTAWLGAVKDAQIAAVIEELRSEYVVSKHLFIAK